MIYGLNHITFVVSDVEKSFKFYTDVLGLTPHLKWEEAAYLHAGNFWLCLYKGEPAPSDDYSHLALSVKHEDYDALKARLQNENIEHWRRDAVNEGSVYIYDPDKRKLEITCEEMNQFAGINEPLYPDKE